MMMMNYLELKSRNTMVTVCFQVIIIQFGGMAFATKGLTLDQWMWCVFFGVGTLLWGQVRTVWYDKTFDVSF
jgi:multidrug transporter EmrE-like cation transporter